MQPMGPSQPEFDSLGCEAIARPEWGTGYVPAIEFFRRLREPIFQDFPGGKRLRLTRSPRPNLAFARAGGEIGVRLFRRYLFNQSFRPDLFAESYPIEASRRFGVFIHLLRFGAPEIRVKDEASLVQTVE